ncbi:MAG: hypothetical protein ACREA1_03730 [Nitrosotalea sp.]
MVEISGFVKNPTYDGLYLKIFDNKAELVWLFQVKLDENNNYKITLPLSDPVWNESAFYVVTAKTGGIINTTSFEINPSHNFQEKTTSIVLQTFDKFFQNVFFLPIVGIFIIGIVVYALYSIRQVQKNITVLKHKSLPLITFNAPSPTKVHLQNGTSINYEAWDKIPEDQRPKLDSVEFWIAIKNIGGNTAKNITSLFIQKEEIFSRHDMKIEEGKIPYEQVLFPELAPGEFYYYDFKISWNQFAKLRENNLFIGLLASYDKHEIRGCSGIIFGMGEGGNYTMDEWFTCQ